MTIFRRLFEKHFLNQIPYAAMVNLSRLAAQWEDRINKTIHQMKEQALKYVHDELGTIEALLLKVGGRTEEIRQAMDKLREEMEALAG